MRSYNAILAERGAPQEEANNSRIKEDEEYEVQALREECARLSEFKILRERELL